MAHSFHINDLNSLGDLQVDFKFRIEFFPKTELSTFIQNFMKAGEGYTDGSDFTWANNIFNQAGNEGKNFTAYARSISFPGRSNGALEDHFMGWKTIYPGKMEYPGTFTVTFAERQTGAILRGVQAWQEGIIATKAKSGRGSFQKTGDFKKDWVADIKVVMLTTDGNDAGMAGFYYNCWPSARNEVELSMESSDFVKPSIVFNYDWSRIASATKDFTYTG